MLTALTATFRELGIDVVKADVDGDADNIRDTFYVTQVHSVGVHANDALLRAQSLEDLSVLVCCSHLAQNYTGLLSIVTCAWTG